MELLTRLFEITRPIDEQYNHMGSSYVYNAL